MIVQALMVGNYKTQLPSAACGRSPCMGFFHNTWCPPLMYLWWEQNAISCCASKRHGQGRFRKRDVLMWGEHKILKFFIRSIHVYTLKVLVSLPQKWPHKKKSSLSQGVHELDGGTRRVLKLFSFKTKIKKNNLMVFMCRVKPQAADIIEITAYMTWSLARSPLFW